MRLDLDLEVVGDVQEDDGNFDDVEEGAGFDDFASDDEDGSQTHPMVDPDDLRMLGYGEADPSDLGFSVRQAIAGVDVDEDLIRDLLRGGADFSDDIHHSELMLGGGRGIMDGIQIVDKKGLSRWERNATPARAPGSRRRGSERFPDLQTVFELRNEHRKKMGIPLRNDDGDSARATVEPIGFDELRDVGGYTVWVGK